MSINDTLVVLPEVSFQGDPGSSSGEQLFSKIFEFDLVMKTYV